MTYTFYSFKGGVGRSMALANVAELFYGRGMRVLMVDFDLEAPGLERFFDQEKFQAEEVRSRRGIVDLLYSYLENYELAPALPSSSTEMQSRPMISTEPLATYLVPIYDGQPDGRSLHLLTAGERKPHHLSDYAERVLAFDWKGLYAKKAGADFFEWFRMEAEKLADVVLIDSRTGVTEMGGVCTHQLADVVVCLLATNQQNLDGTQMMAQSLSREELKSTRGRDISLVFVPSRVENSAAPRLDEFESDFKRVLLPYATKRLTFRRSAFIDLKIPYTPEYAYREDVAVRGVRSASKADLVDAFERLAESLAKLARPESRLYLAYKPTLSSTDQLVQSLEAKLARFTTEQIEDAKDLFTRLVHIESNDRFTARKAGVKELNEGARRIAAEFDVSVINSSDSGISLADVDLVARWERLRQWIREDFVFLTWRQELTEMANAWDKSGRKTRYLLDPGDISAVWGFLPRRDRSLSPLEHQFVTASTAEMRRQVSASQKQRQFSIVGRILSAAIVALFAYSFDAILNQTLQAGSGWLSPLAGVISSINMRPLTGRPLRFVQAVVIQKGVEPASVTMNVCEQRTFTARLLQTISTAGPVAIGIDKYYSSQPCDAATDETFRATVLQVSRQIPVVVGCSYGSEAPFFSSDALQCGSTRLNSDTRILLLAGPDGQPSLAAAIASAAYPAETAAELATVRNAKLITRIIAQKELRTYSAISLVCSETQRNLDWRNCMPPSQATLQDLRGRVVIVGEDTPESHTTTAIGVVPSYVLQASYVEALLGRQFLRVPATWVETLVIFLCALALQFVHYRFTSRTVAVSLVMVTTLVAMQYLLASLLGYYISVLPAALALLTVTIALKQWRTILEPSGASKE